MKIKKKSDIEKENQKHRDRKEKRNKFASKEFHRLSTPEKWELLEIVAKEMKLVKEGE